uniref:Gnk2-homologous domain-containing protein n=1 Tax=Aegilops tauschii subsp. strangulata TaxID=200361 RepID=A0A453BCF1_AEGTS
IIFYDLCQLRFSNRNFFLDDDYLVTTYTLLRSRVVGTPAFDAAVGLLLNATADHAVEDSSRRFGTGEEGFDDRRNPKIYALAQCAPEKTADVCRSCLNVIIGQLPNSFRGRTGGGMFGVWCNFRYEVYPFFPGRPLVQLPRFVERPPASAPPVTGGEEKKRNSAGKVLAILMPTIAVILAIAVVYFFCWRKRRPEEDAYLPSASDDIQHIDSLLLDLATLRIATDDFDNSKMLGKGGFGMVYKV